MKVLKINKIILFILFCSLTLLSQKNNPIDFPYGGTIDTTGKTEDNANNTRIIFNNKLIYVDLEFNGYAKFKGSYFNNALEIINAKFLSNANFSRSYFYKEGFFINVVFKNWVGFNSSNFLNNVEFNNCRFESSSNFEEVVFHEFALFHEVFFRNSFNISKSLFNGISIFHKSTFNDEANFEYSVFNRKVEFTESVFNNITKFNFCSFKDSVLFNNVKFFKNLELEKSTFYEDVFFINSEFEKKKPSNFINARIYKNVYIGNYNKPQIFDFKRTNFVNDDSHIVFTAPAQVKIQIEKFKHILLNDTLDYYTKKDIISNLKDNVFNKPTQSKERFELDYIFAKSTLYQKESPEYELYSAINPQAWLIFLYNSTMGMGYRPFIIIWYVIFFILLFSIIYFLYFPDKVYQYIKRDSKLTLTDLGIERFIHCIYFSSMLFFTIRFKKELFFEFSQFQKIIISLQWIIGLGFYISFLTLSKAGSILHTLKSLFIG